MAAPYDVKGRYQGGISTIVNSVIESKKNLAEVGLEIVGFDTCRVKRTIHSSGKFCFGNIKNFIDIFYSLPKEINKSKVSVLYYHSSKGFALLKDLVAIRHARRKAGVKTVLHIHFAEYAKIMTGLKICDKIIIRIIDKDISKVVLLSNQTLEEFVSHGLKRNKFSIIYNFSTVEYTSDEQAKALENRSERCRFLFMGSIDRRKGICDILECLTNCDEKFEFHICGSYCDEEIKRKVKNYIKQIKSPVIEHGYITGEQKRKVLLNSDVLVLPTYAEGLPMVIIEALHAGCAIISTSVGAIPEIIGKKNGFIIEPGNREQLLAAIKVLIENPSLLATMKEENLRISKQFTLKKFISSMSTICRELE